MKNGAFLVILLLYIVGCSSPTIVQNNSCNAKEFVKTVKNATGIIYFADSTYIVRTAHANTYDSVDIGFVCNIPDSLKKDGLKLQFDGQYFEYDGTEKSPFIGTTYYYVSLSNVILLND